MNEKITTPTPQGRDDRNHRTPQQSVLEEVGAIRDVFAVVSKSGQVMLFNLNDDPEKIKRVLDHLDRA